MWTLLETPDEAEKNATPTLASQLPVFDRESILNPPPPVTSRARAVCNNLALGILALVLVVTLLAQLVYRHFDVIAASAQLRPWLQTICAQTGCALPPQHNVGLWQSESLSVNPHPEFADVVSIEIDLRNTASFSQPAPSLAITFSDIGGAVVAARQFPPSDYLASALPPYDAAPGELLAARLALADPGAEAVNYRVQFVYE